MRLMSTFSAIGFSCLRRILEQGIATPHNALVGVEYIQPLQMSADKRVPGDDCGIVQREIREGATSRRSNIA
jgi:hypothetical protein